VQLIELAAGSLANVKFFYEKKLIYPEETSPDSGKYCFGIANVLKVLVLGAVETPIVWENLWVSLPSSFAMLPEVGVFVTLGSIAC
jgi:peptide chain release factor subunit 1